MTRAIVQARTHGPYNIGRAGFSYLVFARRAFAHRLDFDMSVQDLEKVIYFASYIVTKVDEAARQKSAARSGKRI